LCLSAQTARGQGNFHAWRIAVAATHVRIAQLPHNHAMPRSRRPELWDRLVAGDMRNIGFVELRRLVEAFGFTLRRISGSHHIYTHPQVIYTHPQVPRPLSLQPRQREAKPYQIKQFLEMVHTYGLRMERRR
jgi:predicted RNA binding protein YcfA (HicA-like mRNA interferase family)